jgi:hypothetical protein
MPKFPDYMPPHWEKGPLGSWFAAKPSRIVGYLCVALLLSLALIAVGLMVSINALVAGGIGGSVVVVMQGMIYVAGARRAMRNRRI